MGEFCGHLNTAAMEKTPCLCGLKETPGVERRGLRPRQGRALGFGSECDKTDARLRLHTQALTV